MRLHPNAKTTPKARALLIARLEMERWTVRQVAAAAGVSVRTVYKWRARYRAEGEAGLCDRSQAPRRIPHRTRPAQIAAIRALRSQRLAAVVDITDLVGHLWSPWKEGDGVQSPARHSAQDPGAGARG